MTISDFSVHPKFTLNGCSYTKDQLKELSVEFVKSGSSFEKSIGIFLSNWLQNTTTIEVETSGSTGTPKTILLQKSHMVNSARATGDYFDLRAGDSALLCLPAEYIAGKMMLVRALVLGLELDYVDPSSNPLSGIDKSYDFIAMVPLQVQNSFKQIDQIKTLIVGGAAMSTVLKGKVQDVKTEIYETYGMTETVTHIAVKRTNGLDKWGYFQALPNVSFSTDERNCLIIEAAKVSDDTVQTNDIVKLISETEFEWLGRYDNVINSGGVKLLPERIEAKLEKYISNRFFVCGIPDEKLGEKLVLLIEGDLEPDFLLKKLRDSKDFYKFEIPKGVHLLSQFKETATGKVHRDEIRKQIMA